MRFRKIDLIRFGIFTDRCLELPGADADLHIVVGPNEAGKSTTRAAVGDLLFGIGGQTSYSFLHEYRDMCIGAVIEDGAATLEIRRRKRSKNTLTDAADSPLPQGRLDSVIGNTDREFFERMFSLDHAELVRGGQNILDARDDVGRMLFESVSGIGGLAELRRDLEEEAALLWTPRKNQKAAYHRALDGLKEAQRKLDAAAVRVPEWTQLRKALEAAEAEHAKGVDDYSRLESERKRLDRLSRVAPLLALRERKLADRASLGTAAILPADARAVFEETERHLRELAITIAQLESAIDGCLARASVDVDELLLSRRAAVERLVAESNRVGEYPEQIAKRRAEVDTLLAEVGVLARALGYRDTDPEVLRDKLPASLLRSTLETLSRGRDKLDADLRNAKTRRESQQRESEELEQALRAAPPSEMPANLFDAMHLAESLGDIAARAREQEEHCRDATRRCERELARLAPWSGSLEELASVAVPAASELTRLNSERERIRASLQSAREALAQARRAADAKESEVAALARNSQAISAEDLSEVRRRRDQAWGTIRVSFVAGSAEGTEDDRSAHARVLDLSIESADNTADRRLQGASQSARLEQAMAARDELRDSVLSAAERVATDEAALAELDRQWLELLAPLQLGGLDHADVAEWLQHRSLALATRGDADKATTTLDQLRRNETTATKTLRAALAGTGLAESEFAGIALPGLTALARRVDRQVAESLGKRRHGEDRLAKLRHELPDIEFEVKRLETDSERWRSDWQEALAAAGLPAQTAPQTIGQAMGWFRDLDEKIGEISRTRVSRIAKMQSDLDAFAAAVGDLARAVAPDVAAQQPVEIASVLRTRLDAARQADSTRRDALAENKSKQAQFAEAVAARSRLEAALAPLMEMAGAGSLAGLRQAIERSELARKLDEEAEGCAERAIEAGEGRNLADLEREDSDDDRDSRAARSEALRRQIDDAQSRREAAAMNLSRARAALDEVAGQADAAAAAEEREGALAETRDSVERYVKVRIAARLLGWAVERYRREKQGPLLRRAGELFATLTLGSFVRLEADEEDGKQRIVAVRNNVRNDGRDVAVDGMSTGARDQLYLALRVAALETQVEKATALPVIVDDVLINFDDERAAAGLRVFAELAGKTQVLIFTHHRHLVDVARQALGAGVSVLEL